MENTDKYINTIMPLKTTTNKFRPLLPSNIQDIYNLPYRKKTIGSSKNASKIVRFVLTTLKWKMGFYGRDYAKLSANDLKANYNDPASNHQIMSTLIDNNIIVLHREYSSGSHSREYRFGYAMENVSWYQSTEYEEFKVSRHQEDRKDKLSISVDVDLYDKTIGHIAEFRGWNTDEKLVWDFSVKDGFSNEVYPSKTGRVYEYFSFLPKEIRGTLLIGEEPVVELDISNCNPLLLTSFYHDVYPETEHYKELVESGKFYEDIKEKMGYTNRDEVKEDFNSWICGKRASTPLIDSYLKTNFPILHNNILMFRETENGVLPYKACAHRLQKIESNIVVNKVCSKYNNAFSIHDGILTVASNADTIKEDLQNTIKEELGLDATIKLDNKREKIQQLIK